MEMDKYYTPEIEEFHVGFEFECEPHYWIKHTLEVKDMGIDVDGCHDSCNPFVGKPEGFRVKYLDQSDIESLGFRLISKDKDDEFDWIVYRNQAGYEIQSWGDNKYSIEHFPGIGKTVKFCGIIKNLSKLKVILKDIGL